jgi:hypothetical protein
VASRCGLLIRRRERPNARAGGLLPTMANRHSLDIVAKNLREPIRWSSEADRSFSLDFERLAEF